jgi:hypothetical protein
VRGVLAILVAAVLVVSVSSLAWQRRAVERKILDDADESDRYVDMGVLLSVVEMDLKAGFELEPGKPPVKIVRQHRLGGMLDTWTRKIVGPSARPRYWQCSTQQEPLILHDAAQPVWTLIQGSEGAGKTVTLAMWIYCRVLEHCGHDREIGVTAPVFARLGHVKKAIATLWDPKWYRWKERDQSYRFRAGPLVQLVSAHQQSENAGSPIQGANWVACASDELQDHFDREADIVARGRSAPGGIYKRLCTSTFKDSSEWRTFRDVASKAPDWRVAKLLGLDSPFVWPKHWERFRANGITAREYQRRVLAMDVGPEAQLYHCWSRKLEDGSPGNLRPIPLGAEDVTAEQLAPYASPGERLTILVGHDPGKRQHVSVFLKAYRFRGEKVARWFVVDELTTVDATIEKHVADVIARARSQWHAHQVDRRGQADPTSGRMLVRADPHTRSGDEHPDATMYTVWRAQGIKIRAAAYKPGSTEPGVIKREARFNLMNTLLCDVNGNRRLLVACDDTGRPAAPALVKALESMERNAEDRGEHEKKNGDDLSHWPAAVGYALWQIEHPRLAMGVAS